jgi:carbon-monoxide dehydrogenase medium subunit
MKPAPFHYSAPEGLEEALVLLREYGDEARPLAGGQSLMPLMNLRMARFAEIVDLNRIASLESVSCDDGELIIGAMTRQAVIERDATIRRHSPLLSEATEHIAHFQIRNRGTIGGSLAHADPAAEYPTVALVLDAQVQVACVGGRRRLRMDDLVMSAYTTTLAPDELLVSVHVPDWGPRSGCAMHEISRRRGDFALIGGAAAIALGEDDRVHRARVALFGVADRPRRLGPLEEALIGAHPDHIDVASAAVEAIADLHPPSDVLATGAYRRQMAAPLAARVVSTAIGRARSRDGEPA